MLDPRFARKLPVSQHPMLLELYDQGMVLKQIAALVGLHESRVRDIAKKYGRPNRRPGRKLPKSVHPEVLIMYDQGIVLTKIGEHFGVSDNTIRKVAADYGRQPRGRRLVKPDSPLGRAIVERYERGVSYKVIARIHKVSPSTIQRVVRKSGCRMRGLSPWLIKDGERACS